MLFERFSRERRAKGSRLVRLQLGSTLSIQLPNKFEIPEIAVSYRTLGLQDVLPEFSVLPEIALPEIEMKKQIEIKIKHNIILPEIFLTGNRLTGKNRYYRKMR